MLLNTCGTATLWPGVKHTKNQHRLSHSWSSSEKLRKCLYTCWWLWVSHAAHPCTTLGTSITQWAFISVRGNFQPSCLFSPLLTCCETGRADPGLCRFCLVFSESVYADWLLQYVHIYIYIYFSQELKLGVPSHWSLPSVRWQKCLFCYTLNCIQTGSSKGKIL